MPTLTFDVTDPLYGATGDGSTNDRPAIAAAIAAAVSAAAASATKRAVVHFPPGIYSLNTMVPDAGNPIYGGHAFRIGNHGGSPISLHFTGSNATLKNTVWSATGATYRTYRIFDIFPNLTDLRFDGITFIHEAEGVLNYNGTFDNRTAALYCWAASPYPLVEDITVTNCEFIDHTWAMRFEYDVTATPTVDYGEAFNYKRLEFTHNRVLGKSYDVTAAVINGVDGGIGIMEEVIITDNFFDGARTGDVSGSVSLRGADGFVYLSNPKRCVISNNVVKHAAVEGIFLTPTNPSPLGPPASVTDVANAVVANNVIEGTAPTGQSLNLAYGIRVDIPNVVVSNNVITNTSINGILLTTLVENGSRADRNLCEGNHILMDGKAAGAGIWCLGKDVDIKDNYIWIDTYTSPGTAGQFVQGIASFADGHRITGNRVFARSKNAPGGLETVGVHINNSGQKETIVTGNLFKNLNNAIYDFGAGIDAEIYDNEVLDCDVLLGTGHGGLDHHWYGKLWCKRQSLRWTPAQTGWHRVATTAHGQISGRLRISSDKEYGGAWSTPDMRPMDTEVVLEGRGNAAGTPQVKRLVQTLSSNLNSGPVTRVRLTTASATSHLWYLEVHVDSITSAKEVILEWESAERGCGLCVPAPQSGTTVQAALLLGPGYRYSENADPLNNGSLMRLGNTGYLWVDSTGDLRIAGSSPTQSNETSLGTVVGTQS